MPVAKGLKQPTCSGSVMFFKSAPGHLILFLSAPNAQPSDGNHVRNRLNFRRHSNTTAAMELHLIALVLTKLFWELPVYSDQSLGCELRRGSSRRLLSMRNRPFTLATGVMLMLGVAGPA